MQPVPLPHRESRARCNDHNRSHYCRSKRVHIEELPCTPQPLPYLDQLDTLLHSLFTLFYPRLACLNDRP